MIKRFLPLLITVLAVLFFQQNARGQTDELPKYEVGAHFTSLTKPSFGSSDTSPGVGGTFTFNFNSKVALEAVGNFFPSSCRGCGGFGGDNTGHITQGLVGVKAGKRFEKWGIFAKARPGFVSFSDGDTRWVLNPAGSPFPVELQRDTLTNFAFDLGGVVEFYPTKRLVTRFEAGDTMIHYRSRATNGLGIDPVTGGLTLFPFTTRSETRHNFQFVAGIGWRF